MSIKLLSCSSGDKLVCVQGLLKPGTDLEDPDVARPHITLDVDITLDSKPPEVILLSSASLFSSGSATDPNSLAEVMTWLVMRCKPATKHCV